MFAVFPEMFCSVYGYHQHIFSRFAVSKGIIWKGFCEVASFKKRFAVCGFSPCNILSGLRLPRWFRGDMVIQACYFDRTRTPLHTPTSSTSTACDHRAPAIYKMTRGAKHFQKSVRELERVRRA